MVDRPAFGAGAYRPKKSTPHNNYCNWTQQQQGYLDDDELGSEIAKAFDAWSALECVRFARTGLSLAHHGERRFSKSAYEDATIRISFADLSGMSRT